MSNTLDNILLVTKKLDILYVEDNQESKDQAVKTFSNYFNLVHTANDGAEGLQFYNDFFYKNNKHYDILITDIKMPNMTGIELSKKIHEINNNQIILVIYAYDDKKYLIELLNLGISGFIQKPLSFDEINRTLNNLIANISQNEIMILNDDCTYNKSHKLLMQKDVQILLTKNETRFIDFMICNHGNYFELSEIFEEIFFDEPDKTFTNDSMKGLIKRLRKKLPAEMLLYSRYSGYSINLKNS